MGLPIKLFTTKVSGRFFSSVMTQKRINSLTIVSPWITDIQFEYGNIDLLLKKIEKEKINTYIITRSPEHKNHVAIINKLKNQFYIELSFNDTLHAKYYICESIPINFALIGSANMTYNSQNLLEIGVMVDGVRGGEGIVRQLEDVTNSIRVEKNTKRIKKIGGTYHE